MICFVPLGFVAFMYILCGAVFLVTIVVGGAAAIVFGILKVLFDWARYRLRDDNRTGGRFLTILAISGLVLMIVCRTVW
jgi:hypothetical protein